MASSRSMHSIGISAAALFAARSAQQFLSSPLTAGKWIQEEGSLYPDSLTIGCSEWLSTDVLASCQEEYSVFASESPIPHGDLVHA